MFRSTLDTANVVPVQVGQLGKRLSRTLTGVPS
jgi:hypothetical protein